MQDRLTHAVCVLLALVLTLTHVYIGYDFAPVCLDVQLGQFLLADRFLAQILGRPLDLFLLFLSEIFLELPFPLSFASLLLLPFSFLSYNQPTLLSLSKF